MSTLGPIVRYHSVLRVSRALPLFFSGLLLAAGLPAMAQSPVAFPNTTNVNPATPPTMTVTVAITVSGSGTAAAVTQGVTNGEFTVVDAGTCTGALTAPTTCSVTVGFSPKFPGLRAGAVVVTASSGTVLMGKTLVVGKAMGGLAVLNPGIMSTVAGDGAWIYQGDSGPAQFSPIFLPTGVVSDAAGNIYLSDSNNNRVRRVDAKSTVITTVAGTGSPGFSGDGALASRATVSSPSGLVLDGAGDLFFVDTGNQCVRRIDATTLVITTVAGKGGVQGYTGDGQLATSATLSLPQGLAMDPAGNLYIADTGNEVIRRVDAVSGIITTFAGTGLEGYNGDKRLATTALLYTPWGVAAGADGSVYVADLDNNRVRKIDTSGMITTVAGNGTRAFAGDGADATKAELNAPAAVVFDPAGNMYIADSGNNRVREVTISNGYINTISGEDSEQFAGDGLPSNVAAYYGPYSLYFDQAGNLLIADMFHNRIRKISATTITLPPYAVIRVSKTSQPQAEGLANDGNADMRIKSFDLVNSALDSVTTTCVVGTLSMGTGCNLGVEFAPTTVGNLIYGTLTVDSDAGNTPDIVTLDGQVLTVNPTTVTVTSNVNPSLLNAAVTFTAVVSSSDTTVAGTIDFLDGSSTVLCKAVTVAAKAATCTVSNLALGSHNVTASYTGDTDNASSVSPVYVQVVQQQATLALSAAPNPVIVTNTVTLSVTATAATGVPSGMVTFYDGTTMLSSATLNGQGFASVTTDALTPGTHNLTVKYAGDTANAPGVSSVVKEVVKQGGTLTMLGSSNATSTVGQAVTFTASVSSTDGLVTPTEDVTFTDGATTLGKVPLVNGSASLTISTLAPVVPHSIIATYDGDTNDATSSSTALAQTVLKIGTTTALATDVNPSSAGATVTLTATVAMVDGATADGVLAGQVSFLDGGKVIGSAPLNAQGIAVLPVKTLTVGTHALTASYVESANYATSSSAAVSEVVASTSTTTTLTAGGTGALAGKTVTLTAVVGSNTGTPTGTVKFVEGTTTLGQVTLSGSATAVLSLTTLSVGTHNIVAVYSGDANYVDSSSLSLSQLISLGTPTVTLTGPTGPVNAGAAANFTVTFATNGVAPTGVLTLFDGTTTISSKTLSATGTFVFSSSTIPVGTHTMTASYAGDPDNATAVSGNVTLVVQQAPSSTSLSSSQNPQTLGQNVTLTASVTSGSPGLTGTVNFLDGATLLGSSSVGATGIATYSTSTLTAGAHSLTAVYLGDTNHAGSSAPSLVQHMVQPSQIGLSSNANPTVAGASVTFSVKMAVTGTSAPTGTVNFLDSGQLIGSGTLDGTGAANYVTTALSVGVHNITASYAGDVNYSSVTSALLQESVTSANTQVALTASANPATYGSPLTFGVTVTSNGGVATGVVTLLDGGKSIGTVTLSGGAGSLTLSTLSAGTHSIVANYAGDGKASASASSPVTVVVKQTAAVSVATNASPAQTLSAIVLTATVTNAGQSVPTGQVTFTDGAVQLGGAQVGANGVAMLTVPQLSAGNHTIVASYAGDNVDFAATSGPLVQVVSLRPTTTTLSATTDPTNNQQVTLIGVVRWTGSTVPTGTVTFTNGSAVLGSIPVDATGVATLPIVVGTASESIVATYAGDTAYAGSASSVTTIGSTPSTEFTMVINPGSVSVAKNQHTTVTLTLGSLKNFGDTMSFGCLGLPTAATCTFSTTQMALKSGGTGTVQLTIDTGDPLGAGGKATSSLRSKETGVMLCFLPGMALIGLLWRRRTKFVGVLVLLVAFGMMFATTGCGGLQVNGTPPGTYKFQVTALGQNTGVSQSQTMTLTVTQ